MAVTLKQFNLVYYYNYRGGARGCSFKKKSTIYNENLTTIYTYRIYAKFTIYNLQFYHPIILYGNKEQEPVYVCMGKGRGGCSCIEASCGVPHITMLVVQPYCLAGLAVN